MGSQKEVFEHNYPGNPENSRSAYRLNGIFGNPGENSNGTIRPGGKFSEKRYYLSRCFLFLALTGIPGNFCTVSDLSTLTSTRLPTVILPRDLKDGGRFPKRLSAQCVSLICSSIVLAEVFEDHCNPVGENGLSCYLSKNEAMFRKNSIF